MLMMYFSLCIGDYAGQFVLILPFTLTDIVGSTRCTDVPIINDNLVEFTEQFVVRLQVPNGLEVGNIETATIYIVNDDCKSIIII